MDGHRHASDGVGAPPIRPSPDDWLVGGGQMAATIKGMNWSETRLGPIASWPQRLRTTVSLVQASNAAIALVWGRGHVQIYNDGYRELYESLVDSGWSRPRRTAR
jgi:hypothetical protein